jgi:hypothetical protein
MDNRELLRTLSGCKFYQNYLEAQEPVEPPQPKPERPKPEKPKPPDSRLRRRLRNRVYRKYCVLIGALVLGALVLIISPLWLVHPPYGKAFLLSLPPMALCAVSWMAGAWWAWGRDKYTFMAVTMGATPARLFLGLGWAWLVLSIPEIPFFVFMIGLMWHWLIFTVPELAMVHELSQNERAKRPSTRGRITSGTPKTPASEAKV